ncbi:MAG: glycoside hydrolase [Halobacteriales archaeon]|nr:glycoside hydrolase [Halobacteriales archaeon]
MRPGLLILVALLLAGCAAPGPAPDAPAHVELFHELCALSNWNLSGETCSIHASPNDSPSKAEIDLAVNPRDPLNVVVGSKDLDRKASDCVWAVPQVSTDGGKTWATQYIGGDKASRQADPTNPLFLWDCVTDPILVFDNDGILYYGLQAYNSQARGPQCPQEALTQVINTVSPIGNPARGCGSSFYLATSADGGRTWPNDRIKLMALGDGGAVFHDYPRMVLNPKTGTVSTVWNAITTAGANAYVVSTRDQGQSVTQPTVVSDQDAATTTIFASGFAADAEGTVYMTVDLVPTQELAMGNPGPRTVYLATSTDDSATFGGFTKMFEVTNINCPLANSKFRCGTSIELAADVGKGPYAGRLYAVWDDGRNQNQSDILASWSTDHGATWSSPVLVNQDHGANDQWMARVKVGLDGAVHVLFMDRSYDPGNKLYGATHAWSVDGGAHWQQQRLTTALSDGDLGVHQGGFPFIGDYVGIDVAGDQGQHVYLGWPETVTGKAEIAVAHVMKAT